jgi:hypothetical protein
MQLPMGFTQEQFFDGQRAAEFLGLPRKTLLNRARREVQCGHIRLEMECVKFRVFLMRAKY